jgi:hypothetical protein
MFDWFTFVFFFSNSIKLNSIQLNLLWRVIVIPFDFSDLSHIISTVAVIASIPTFYLKIVSYCSLFDPLNIYILGWQFAAGKQSSNSVNKFDVIDCFPRKICSMKISSAMTIFDITIDCCRLFALQIMDTEGSGFGFRWCHTVHSSSIPYYPEHKCFRHTDHELDAVIPLEWNN